MANLNTSGPERMREKGKRKNRTPRIVGCSILLAQQLAILIGVPISILDLHATGHSFVLEIVAAVAFFAFFGACAALAAVLLWGEIKNRPLL